jgi:hypothetical protein
MTIRRDEITQSDVVPPDNFGPEREVG